jgi:hypothetical protein
MHSLAESRKPKRGEITENRKSGRNFNDFYAIGRLRRLAPVLRKVKNCVLEVRIFAAEQGGKVRHYL